MRKITQQQMGFVQDILKEVPQGRAYMAHYKVKSMAVADVCASQLIRTPKIQAYIQQLRQKMEDEAIAGPIERKKILTEIARARMTDFLTCSADGVWMHDIGPENMNTAGLKKVETTTMPFGGEESNLKIILTKVELADPTRAIDLLNKMDKLYSEGGNTYNDIKVVIVRERPIGNALQSKSSPLTEATGTLASPEIEE